MQMAHQLHAPITAIHYTHVNEGNVYDNLGDGTLSEEQEERVRRKQKEEAKRLKETAKRLKETAKTCGTAPGREASSSSSSTGGGSSSERLKETSPGGGSGGESSASSSASTTTSVSLLGKSVNKGLEKLGSVRDWLA